MRSEFAISGIGGRSALAGLADGSDCIRGVHHNLRNPEWGQGKVSPFHLEGAGLRGIRQFAEPVTTKGREGHRFEFAHSPWPRKGSTSLSSSSQNPRVIGYARTGDRR